MIASRCHDASIATVFVMLSAPIILIYIEHYIYIHIQINLSYMFGQFGPNCDLIYPPSPASGLLAAIITNIMIIMMTTCVFLLMETNMCHFHKLGHLYVLTDVFFLS